MNRLSRVYRKYRWYFLPTLRMKSIVWIDILQELEKQFKRLSPGLVVDIGGREAPYKHMVPYKRYLILDIDESSQPDIVANAEKIPIGSDLVDTVLCIETLEHVRYPNKVIDEIYRILKGGGVCILSTPFIHPYHPGPEDHYRFSKEALKELFKTFGHIDVISYGNRFQMFFQFLNIRNNQNPFWAVITDIFAAILNPLNPIISKIKYKDNFPFGHVVYAIK